METPLLQGLGLHKAFGPDQALSAAGLELGQGEIVAVMGPSGSGKSTLLHCLSGIVRPDRGQVLFRGRALSAMSDIERSALRRTEFGFVFQFGQLVPELTCLENVALPLRLGGMKRRPAERLAETWLGKLEVTDVAGNTPGRVSGGQGQRVAMARALITEPSVIFADEPTGALDTFSGEQVMRLLSETAKQTNAAVVLVTHEPRVAAYSDREVIVRDGRTHEPVVTR
ncbi:macrolide ABC transporter ATP-binding protein [Amycolatopsis coloradensis]|uniref:Macrolide ABC transporter ATP-binding protein n=1 Tax=Amycolatopsis coloradensis TaxID=76021 RepID=A0A1R0KQ70_9PSEU|nr:ABC transporter ATP-binding protein [Amycolatopsis coloradensis]OLZ49332.1 macrolide ABC transporter ATP-binding protein [Amycolatopsis coloradensis]